MTAVFITVFTGFIGLSMPYPVFSHLFLSEYSSLLPVDTVAAARTVFLGIAIALFPMGQAIASPIWGTWSDRYGRKPILICSLALASFGMFVVAIAIYLDMLYLLLLGRLISGLGEGNIAIAQAIASDAKDETSKARNFAAISIAMNAGWIVGPLLGGVLGDNRIAAFTGPTLPFWLATLMYLFNMVIVSLLIKEPDTLQDKPSAYPGYLGGILLRDQGFRAVMLLTLFSFFGTYIMFSFFAPYFVQMFNVPPAELGLYAALLSVPLILAGIYAERVNRWLGTTKMTVLALLLMAVGLATFILPDSLIWLIIPATLTAFGIVFIEVSTAIMVSDMTPKAHQGQAMGVYRSVIVSAEIIAALIGGWLAGLAPAMPYCVAAMVVLLGLPVLIPAISERMARDTP